MKNNREWLEKRKGPFAKKFQESMDEMNLKRQIYHSGALVGGDINTLFSNKSNVNSISSVFAPATISLAKGIKKLYSSPHVVQKVNVMLHKFAAIYSLMSPSRALCQHEVLFLKIRCVSFGNWFPTNFPNENLKRKFHVVTYHVHEKASRPRSVGMEAEHTSESIHPVINALKRCFATIQSLQIQLPLIYKGQWLSSGPTNPDFRSAKKHRHCQRCGQPSHYGKTQCQKQK